MAGYDLGSDWTVVAPGVKDVGSLIAVLAITGTRLALAARWRSQGAGRFRRGHLQHGSQVPAALGASTMPGP